MPRKKTNKSRIYIILCGGSQGRAVVCGFVDAEPVEGQPVTLHDARMVLFWHSSCGGLFGLAATGPKGDTRMTATVPKVTDTEWKQWIVVSDEARDALVSWK